MQLAAIFRARISWTRNSASKVCKAVRRRGIHPDGRRSRGPMADTLPLPARQVFARETIEQFAEASAVRLTFVDPLLAFSRRHFAHLQAEAHIVAGRFRMRVERIGLRRPSRRPALGWLHLIDDTVRRCAVRPPVTFLKPGDHPQQRGLAAAGRADEDDELAILDLEVDAADDVDPGQNVSEGCEG